jgi:hypothetical protein
VPSAISTQSHEHQIAKHKTKLFELPIRLEPDDVIAGPLLLTAMSAPAFGTLERVRAGMLPVAQ